MADPMGEALRLDFDRRLILQFRGSTITSDGGLLAYRELDGALSLTETAADTLADARTGKNGRHRWAGLFRQSVFGRPAGYEDVNDAERLCREPAMRWVVGDRAITGYAASASQMGRFETKWLCRPENLTALADLPGRWIDKVHEPRPPKPIVLDMDSSESPTYGEQEDSAYNGHFGCTCYQPLFVFNQFGDVERCVVRPGNVHSADGWRAALEPVIARYRGSVKRLYFRGDAAFGNPGMYEYLDHHAGSSTIFNRFRFFMLMAVQIGIAVISGTLVAQRHVRDDDGSAEEVLPSLTELVATGLVVITICITIRIAWFVVPTLKTGELNLTNSIKLFVER